MRARDLISLLEYGKAFNKQEKPRKVKKEKRKATFKDFMEFQAEMEQFQKYMKEKDDEKKKLEKAKEHKKDGMSPQQLAMFLVMSFPITAPIYVYSLVYLFRPLLEAVK